MCLILGIGSSLRGSKTYVRACARSAFPARPPLWCCPEPITGELPPRGDGNPVGCPPPARPGSAALTLFSPSPRLETRVISFLPQGGGEGRQGGGRYRWHSTVRTGPRGSVSECAGGLSAQPSWF